MSKHRGMGRRGRSAIVTSGIALGALALLALPFAGGGTNTFFSRHDLVSDGFVPADFTDPNLVNAWGLAASPTGPWWVAAADSGVATVYDGDGNILPLVVSIPGIPGPGEPTGMAFNPTPEFVVSDGPDSGPAAFLFASEDGTISGWNPNVPPSSTQAFIVVDNSPTGAIYKGLALSVTPKINLLYATDFHNNKVDVFRGDFTPFDTHGGFVDPNLPSGFAPFGIAYLAGKIYVTYAMQDAAGEDDVTGEGLGYVDVYEIGGAFVKRLISAGPLNAPWGLALAPPGFGTFGSTLLVGNFGDGRINAFDPKTGLHRGRLKDGTGRALRIDGLWALGFGNDALAGSSDTLYFTAGPDDEAHGLFGRIDAVIGG
jgi:uncharacterized protein (TIGR03118 family)